MAAGIAVQSAIRRLTVTGGQNMYTVWDTLQDVCLGKQLWDLHLVSGSDGIYKGGKLCVNAGMWLGNKIFKNNASYL